MTKISLTSARSGLELSVSWTDDRPASLGLALGGLGSPSVSTQPLVEAMTSGSGKEWAGSRYITTSIGCRLRYESHDVERHGPWQLLRLSQRDVETGLLFTSDLRIHDDGNGLRATTRITNVGSETVRLLAVTSVVFADFAGSDVDSLRLVRGRSDWLAEGRWRDLPLRDAGLPQLKYADRPFRTRGSIDASSTSSWSTLSELPTAVLTNHTMGLSWAFQVEHNGAWLWQIGETTEGPYLALLGPTDEQHQWQLDLEPGTSFSTVPVSVVVEPVNGPPSLAALTAFRRLDLATNRLEKFPIVFNDYMNTVNGDPSADVLHPLINAAADAGADCFVIDAGWYADDGDWWDSVGEWQPSMRRFPQGIEAVIGHIRRRNMVPGLWLEPEVVGVKSPMAEKLPDIAFLQRGGIRVVEHGRYHLDFTAEPTQAFMNETIDRLVGDLGIGYFKFDYNIQAGVGSDAAVPSPAHGLLLHNRAYLEWIDGVRSRHPQLMLENCASGGMRQDHATVSRFDLQSTSDQEDFLAYAPVAAAAPMLVVPEQAANWAYPQPDMTDDEIIYTLSTAMLGRFYLSGWLSQLSERQHELVAAAVKAHRSILSGLGSTTPFWPLGLPSWDDEWIALGLREAFGVVERLHITMWRRGSTASSATLRLPQPPLGQQWSAPAALFPAESPLHLELSRSGTRLVVNDIDGRHAARVVTLTAEPLH